LLCAVLLRATISFPLLGVVAYYKLRSWDALTQFSLAALRASRVATKRSGPSCHSANPLLVDATHQLLIPLSTEV
jgi:hypothetical protein